ALVDAGELPPVEERLPEEPLVIEPLEEIGQYGGILKCASTQPAGGAEAWTLRVQPLFMISSDLKTIVPNIAKGWDLSKDYKTLTIYLRKGMRWSDGVAFTADDFLFWYEAILLDEEIMPVKTASWVAGGELVKMSKVDDYTVRFQFATPYPSIISRLGYIGNWTSNPFAPKHRFEKYHIKYNPKANEVANEEGYDYWWQCFKDHLTEYPISEKNSPDVSLDPWVQTKIDSFGNGYFDRNPYYWKIDTAGNQLP
ncbi:unnamed protein product, partial [marine sediment metagenome]